MLALKNISKSFAGVKALQGVSLAFNAGEVHALCGENGAGKSTLMNIIAGNLQPDSGEIFWKGQPVQIGTVQQAQGLGIGIVYQERSLVDSLSIAENIFTVNQPKNKWGMIDYAALYQQATSLLQHLGVYNLSPKTSVGKLVTAQKGMVEIAKALARNPQLLILDEPTASITHQETESLFRIVNGLKNKGVAVIYISHRMAEVKAVAGLVSVLKDGVYQGTMDAGKTPVEEIVRKMVGRDLGNQESVSHVQKRIKLETKSLSGKGFHRISFVLHEGEILGFAGLLGSGRTALARTLFGDLEKEAGQIFKDGRELRLHHPADAIGHGIAYVPDDRKALGLFSEKSVAENIRAAKLNKGLYRQAETLSDAKAYKESLGIKAPSVRSLVRTLSGGNQQKVVMAKWLNTAPDVFILNEPTHGVDVGAKGELYSLLKKLTARGKSILLISSELPELLLLCDRISVMYNGSLQAVLNRGEATEEKLAALASGI